MSRAQGLTPLAGQQNPEGPGGFLRPLGGLCPPKREGALPAREPTVRSGCCGEAVRGTGYILHPEKHWLGSHSRAPVGVCPLPAGTPVRAEKGPRSPLVQPGSNRQADGLPLPFLPPPPERSNLDTGRHLPALQCARTDPPTNLPSAPRQPSPLTGLGHPTRPPLTPAHHVCTGAGGRRAGRLWAGFLKRR